MQDTTDFGFKKIPISQKAKLVANVFSSVANKYDLMNDLMSIGIHRLWKRHAIAECAIRKGQIILDLAGGTGDLASGFAQIQCGTGQIILADINYEMLKTGKRKLLDLGLVQGITFAQADAESLPFLDNTFDCVSIAFGLRNVTHKELALKEMYRVLKPGGRMIILEFSKPLYEILNKLYDTYSFKVLPFLGQVIANDPESYQYLAESIRMHPDQTTLLEMCKQAGFEKCDYQNLTGGICAIHRGFKF